MNGSGGWLHTNVFADGKLLATYGGTDTYFALTDWLGTKRVETDSAGSTVSTSYSLPFGDNLVVDGSPDATQHHFTGKEHDSNTGNDYFLARYYNSATGRFLSPDWSKNPEGVPYADFSDPQSLNLYDYMRNSPLGGVDADGHETAEEKAKKNVDNAKISRGTDRYDIKATVVSNGQVFKSGSDKCNLYVSETVKNSTGKHTTVEGTGKIPTAAQFADPNVKITGLSAPEPLVKAKPGDVIAQDHGPTPRPETKKVTLESW